MMRTLIMFLVIVSLVILNAKYAVSQIPTQPPVPIRGPPTLVPCNHDENSCECPLDAEVCVFEIYVHELHTFTSYKYETVYSDHLVSDIKQVNPEDGTAYSLGSTGFEPIRLPPPSNPPSCYINSSEINEQSFRDIDCSIPLTVDGSTYRTVYTMNGHLSGPTLIVKFFQGVYVRIHNKLKSEDISIHWHGMFQKFTPWADGVGYLHHVGISAGTYFDYTFRAEPAGTHWYHSHIGTHRTNGFAGALIVRDLVAVKPLPVAQTAHYATYNDETVIDNPSENTLLLVDWKANVSPDVLNKVSSGIGFYPDVPIGEVPLQDDRLYEGVRSLDGSSLGPIPFFSGLINGKGRHADHIFSRLSTFTVASNKFYRFRLIGVQGAYAFRFSIEGHKLIVIAIDGFYIEEVSVDYIVIHAGERYDILLSTFRKEASNYLIRAETLAVDVKPQLAEGIIHYENVEEPDPLTKYSNVQRRPRECTHNEMCTVLNCPFKMYPPDAHTTCVRLDELNAAEDSTRLPHILNDTDENLKFFDFGFTGKGGRSAINSISHINPTTPYGTFCTQYSKDKQDGKICIEGTELECIHSSEIVKGIKYRVGGQPMINFVISSVATPSTHPAHLHAHSFHLAYIGYGEYDAKGKLISPSEDIYCNDTKCSFPGWKDGTRPSEIGELRINAIRKDTIIIPAGGYAVIAFESDNPGYWLFHCHIETHQLEGMALIVREYNARSQWIYPLDINNVGNFNSSTDDYYDAVDTPRTCLHRLISN